VSKYRWLPFRGAVTALAYIGVSVLSPRSGIALYIFVAGSRGGHFRRRCKSRRELEKIQDLLEINSKTIIRLTRLPMSLD